MAEIGKPQRHVVVPAPPEFAPAPPSEPTPAPVVVPEREPMPVGSCCKLDCQEVATLEIFHDCRSFECQTLSCDAHVGDLLGCILDEGPSMSEDWQLVGV